MSRRAGDSDRNPNDDNDAAFAEAVRGVRKLGGALRVSPLYAAKQPIQPARRASGGSRPEGGRGRVAGAPSPGMAGAAMANASIQEAGELWTVRADGVDRRVLRKLRAGEMPIEGRLDLHGFTRARAVQALDRFLATSRDAGRRCLLIIHGRGLHSGREGPTLRDAVRAELTAGAHAGAVLACGSAPAELGGAGAVLVLFRRRS